MARDFDKTVRLLYVEDEESIRDALTEVLELFVDHVYVAQNGEEGVVLYIKYQPDFIITDLEMPILNGMGMIKKIREIDTKVPIIISTAFNDNHFLQEAITLNVLRYLVKPVNLAQLRESIQTIKEELYAKRELNAYQNHLEVVVDEAINESKYKSQLLIQQNKSAEIGSMVSVVAHQWKQPVNAISMLIQDIKQAYKANELDLDYIENFESKSMKHITFMSETIVNFLSFYKVKPTLETFSVKEAITTIVSLFSASYKVKNVALLLQVENDFTLYGIENNLMQVILNLIANAKDTIIERKVENGVITIVIEDKVIRVQDNGGGIESQNIEKIFEMNFSTKEEGNGIGLYLSKSIIESKFVGTLDVDNIEDGAEFTMTFY
jgi:two-component system, sensor histidine kinase and response regulator